MPYASTQGSYIRYQRETKRKIALNETRRLAVDLIIQHVHPSNLGTLPPSPRVLLAKAFYHKLITADEYYDF